MLNKVLFTKVVNELQFELDLIRNDVFTANENILKGRQNLAEEKYFQARQKLEFILAKMSEFEQENKFLSEK